VVGDESFVTEDTIDGVLVRTTVAYTDRATNSPIYTETVEQPAGVVLPSYNWDNPTALIVASKLTKTSNYNALTARLETDVESVERPAAFVFPNGGWSPPQGLIEAERTTVAYTYSADGIPSERQTTRLKAVQVGAGINMETDQITIERWTKVGAEEYTYQRSVTNFDESQPPLPELRGASTNNTPPATQYRPAEKQRTEKAYSGEVQFQSLAGGGYADKLWSLQLPSGMGVSTAQATALATLWGRIRQGRQFPIKWAADLSAAWLAAAPVCRVDFSLNGTTTAYLVEGFNLVIDQRSAAVGGRGVELGTVSGGVITPPYTIL
jgi:hypothetical protein